MPADKIPKRQQVSLIGLGQNSGISVSLGNKNFDGKSKKIKECMWYFEEYDSTERRNEFKRKITEAGYNGSYAEFRM